jgi:hypothetical protein
MIKLMECLPFANTHLLYFLAHGYLLTRNPKDGVSESPNILKRISMLNQEAVKYCNANEYSTAIELFQEALKSCKATESEDYATFKGTTSTSTVKNLEENSIFTFPSFEIGGSRVFS